MTRLPAALAIAIALVAGCGGNSPQEDYNRALVDAQLATLDLAIARTIAGQQERPGLESLTAQYIELVREHDDELGDATIRQRLTDAANQMEGYCSTCVAKIDRERENY